VNEIPDSGLHILACLVENKPGVLARVAQLFSRRGFNIFSLAVAPTEDPAFSRITIVVDTAETPIEQITKQLHKLINVIRINELHTDIAVERELMLASVKATPAQRSEILALTDVFGGQVVDVGHDALTLMVADTPARLDACEDLLRPYGFRQLQRTGRVALPLLEREAPRLRVADAS
jgi:acetolactate synthase I/III small subunit